MTPVCAEALEKGTLYTRGTMHVLGVTMKQQVATPPPNFYDRLCNLDGPCNPPFQPFANWPLYSAAYANGCFFTIIFFFKEQIENRSADRINPAPRDTPRGSEREEDRYSRHDVAHPVAIDRHEYTL